KRATRAVGVENSDWSVAWDAAGADAAAGVSAGCDADEADPARRHPIVAVIASRNVRPMMDGAFGRVIACRQVMEFRGPLREHNRCRVRERASGRVCGIRLQEKKEAPGTGASWHASIKSVAQPPSPPPLPPLPPPPPWPKPWNT